MTILEKNETVIRETLGEHFFEQYEAKKEDRENSCLTRMAGNGEPFLCLTRDAYEWRLNSERDPQMAAELYAQRYGKLRDFAILCIFGLSDGRAVRQLLKNGDGSQIVLIFEPDAEVFLTAMEQFPLDDIFEDSEKKFLVIGGINNSILPDLLGSLITYQNMGLVMNCILPNYDIIYQDLCRGYIEKIKFALKGSFFRKNTEVMHGASLGDNILRNLPYILKGNSLTNLKDSFAELDLEQIPAIIVSAGPSLDRNIRELKKAEGKAFIIGVDSSLKALVRENIRFQIAVSVDPNKNPDVFEDDRVNRYPYVLSTFALPLIAEKNHAKLFFADGYAFGVFQKMIEQITEKKLRSLQTGGSVATDAFSLALELGFKKIILIGQDLAFTEGRGHVSGFEKSEEENKKHVAGRVLTEVDALHGGKILTDIQMDAYRQWFEIMIQEHGETITVYNATEGGARIKGTTEISLRDAVAQLCREEKDFDGLIAGIPDMLSASQQIEFAHELLAFSERFRAIEEKISEGICAYDQLIELETGGKQGSSLYKKLLKKIEEVNRIEKKEPYMEFIEIYVKEGTYKATSDIYTSEELSVSEICQRGKALLEELLCGLRICGEHAEEILAPKLKEIVEQRKPKEG